MPTKTKTSSKRNAAARSSQSLGSAAFDANSNSETQEFLREKGTHLFATGPLYRNHNIGLMRHANGGAVMEIASRQTPGLSIYLEPSQLKPLAEKLRSLARTFSLNT
jgi:ribosomal protein L27